MEKSNEMKRTFLAAEFEKYLPINNKPFGTDKLDIDGQADTCCAGYLDIFFNIFLANFTPTPSFTL